MISRKSSVLIIGGFCYSEGCVGAECYSSLIAKYTINKWERVGNLQEPRLSHRAIANDDRIYVVGGYQFFFSKTEIWSIDEVDDEVKIKIAEPTLHYYQYGPELFIVNSDFCTKK